MPIDIQQPNLSGLAAIAGKNVPLNIAPTGALGLQALQQQQQHQAALRANELGRMQLQQQGQLALAAQQNERAQQEQNAQYQQGLLSGNKAQLAQQQQNNQLQLNQNQIENAYKQQALAQAGEQGRGAMAVDAAKVMQEQQASYMKALLEEKKEAIQVKGAYASYALMSLNEAKTPEEAQMISNEIFKEAVEKKYLTAEQAKQMSQMPLSQRKNALKMLVMSLGMTKEFKDLQEQSEGSGNSEVILPDGTVIKSSGATKANITKSQEEYLDANSSIKQLEPYLNPPENFFGLAAAKHDVTYMRELGKILGIGADKKDVTEMALYQKFNANAKLNIMKTAKALAGARFSDADLLMIEQIMPQVGKLETKAGYKAKADLVSNFLKQTELAREEILKTGRYRVGTEEYDAAFSAKLPEIIDKTTDGLRQHLRSFKNPDGSAKYSEQEIDDYLNKGK